MDTKTVFLFDSVTKEFVETWEAQESPREPGVFLEPTHSTQIEPPAPGANQAAVFSGGAWQLVPDHRGEEWFKPDGTAVEIGELGVEPDPDWSQVAPPPTAEQRRRLLQGQACAGLDKTDKVATRCFKAGVAFPPAWRQYTTALRAIANGTDTASTSLPERPDYPEGT